MSKPQFGLEMICPVCAKSTCPMVRADTGGTCDASAPDTGSPASIWKLEEDFFNQARRGRRVQSGGHRFKLRRINALCGSRSGPSTVSNIAAVWRQPIAVAAPSVVKRVLDDSDNLGCVVQYRIAFYVAGGQGSRTQTGRCAW